MGWFAYSYMWVYTLCFDWFNLQKYKCTFTSLFMNIKWNSSYVVNIASAMHSSFTTHRSFTQPTFWMPRNVWLLSVELQLTQRGARYDQSSPCVLIHTTYLCMCGSSAKPDLACYKEISVVKQHLTETLSRPRFYYLTLPLQTIVYIVGSRHAKRSPSSILPCMHTHAFAHSYNIIWRP